MSLVDEKTTRREADNENHVHPWYQVTPEIVEEYPSWEEVAGIFAAEIGPIDRKALDAFRDAEWPGVQHPHETVKIGGWPAWIQAPEREDTLLAQLASDENSDVALVDEGTLFIFVSPQGELDVIVQYS